MHERLTMSGNVSDEKTAAATKAAMNQPDEGTVNIHRRITKHPVWQNVEYTHKWPDLLLLARNHDRHTTLNGQRIELRPGHVYRSINHLQLRWRKGYHWIRAFLKFCVEHLMIKSTNPGYGTDIEIINYDAYNIVGDQLNFIKNGAPNGTIGAAPEWPTNETAKGEQRVKSKEQSGDTPQIPFGEIPSELDILEFCKFFTDMEAGALESHAFKTEINRFPVNWRQRLRNRLISDCVLEKPLARGINHRTRAGRTAAAADSQQIKNGAHAGTGCGAGTVTGRNETSETRTIMSKEQAKVNVWPQTANYCRSRLKLMCVMCGEDYVDNRPRTWNQN